MLTKKIHRQSTYSEKTPPSVGPTTDDTANSTDSATSNGGTAAGKPVL